MINAKNTKLLNFHDIEMKLIHGKKQIRDSFKDNKLQHNILKYYAYRIKQLIYH